MYGWEHTLPFMRRLATICLLGLLAIYVNAMTQHDEMPPDTVQHLEEVVVTSKLTFREVIPSQKLSGEQLERLNTHSVADALRYFSGLQLKDYGGVGGIKTVNIRSMGSNHLGIYYDGVELGNAQNGQIDLGQYSLDNVDEVTLYNGQKSAIFQTASDFGHAGSVYIRTRRPWFSYGETHHLKASVKYGSSDMIRLSGLYEQKLSETLSTSVSAGFLNASGKYKFRYRRVNVDGSTAWDTTAVRQNGDIHAERLEANLHGVLPEGYWSVKAYLYNSERGIPGAIVNNVWRRGERQWDFNNFYQAQWQKSFTNRFSSRVMAKYAYYRTHYVNRDSTQLPVDNTYYQQEAYLTTSHVYELLPAWSVSLSYDLRWNKLNADLYNFAYPTRWSNLVAAATAVDLPRVKMQASLLASIINDRTRRDDSQQTLTRWTPAFFANVYPFRGRFLSLRAFVKKSFRMPTFNDLFYTDMGNASLRPETATQYDAGAVLNKSWEHGLLRHIGIQADAYYNDVRDKIVAYPKGQQFRWTMLNLGKVHIKGIDIEAEADLQPIQGLTLTARLQYTYQDARDVTDPTTPYYRDQIPYIPWHSGSAILGADYGNWSFHYSFIYAGERYNEQENIIYNYMEPWYTNDLALSYQWKWRKARCKATLEVNNLLSQDYDVIVNYPMPKRNYAIALNIQY
jgi:outer membrane cobalamin receptor